MRGSPLALPGTSSRSSGVPIGWWKGVTLALDYLRGAVSRRRPEWAQAHDAILEAVDRHFLASSRLIPAPEADPVLQVALRTIREQVASHCEQPPKLSWLHRMAASLVRIGSWLR